MKKRISIITPCFNEEAGLEACYRAVKGLFKEKLADYDYEHIFCDNASTDKTVDILRGLAKEDRHVKVILNARNYGPFRSMFNGLMHTTGDAAIVMLAADLQDPPELIPEFVAKWKEGYEVVYGVRKRRQEPAVLSAGRAVFYWMVNRFADFEIPRGAGEFQLIDKCVIRALREFDDYYPYVRGMIASCGFKSTGIAYDWGVRKQGLSNNRLHHLIDQAINGIISFSTTPIRICTYLGILTAATAFLYVPAMAALSVAITGKFIFTSLQWALTAVFFMGGVQLFFIGVIGEYTGAAHAQVRRRPLVVMREKINLP